MKPFPRASHKIVESEHHQALSELQLDMILSGHHQYGWKLDGRHGKTPHTHNAK